MDIRGTIYVNPNKRDASSLPYVVRYDDTDESDEEIDMDCLGEDLFFVDNLQEVPTPRECQRESREDLSAAARLLTIHTDEVNPDRDIVGTGKWTLVQGG